MHQILGADFVGFTRSTNRVDFNMVVDPNDDVTTMTIGGAAWSGGGPGDPPAGAVCIPLSGGFSVFRTTSLDGGDWRAFGGNSYPVATTSMYPSHWAISAYVQYERGTAEPPPSISGYIEVYGLFAVYGGIAPSN